MGQCLGTFALVLNAFTLVVDFLRKLHLQCIDCDPLPNGFPRFAAFGMLCRSLAASQDNAGAGLLALLLGLLQQGSLPFLVMRDALHALTRLVAAVPTERRGMLAAIATTGLPMA